MNKFTPQFEYKMVDGGSLTTIEQFNLLGHEGWELVLQRGNHTFIFKRRKAI